MEFVGAALGGVNQVLEGVNQLKDLWPSISKFFNCGDILDNNLTTLRGQMERLESHERDVRDELENAPSHHRKRPRKEVENWLQDVQMMKDDMERMEREVAKRRRCFRWGFLQGSEENIQRARELVELGNFPNGILIDVKDEGMTLATKEVIGESTAQRNLEEIWTCLEEGKVKSIRVWGMGGIGKTTLVTHINNHLLEKKDIFGVVYWVTVSGESSIQRLQDAIAGKINLDLSKEQEEMIRKTTLLNKLKDMGKFVLIFDDMWEVYPPEEIGIPIGDDAGTLIITSRSREVCQKMGCQAIIKVDSLHEKEAWELFNKMLKRHDALGPKEEEIAKDVVKECAGLPLAIVTTARSLSLVYDIAEWKNALNELREHVKGHTIDIENDVFKVLEFSYHRLKDEKIRECLLYCALFPEDYEIQRMSLIRYWIAEGLIEEMGSRQAERDRGHALLNKLENACLLERCHNGDAVRMHDVIRDMAINIARKDSRFLVKGRRNQEVLPTELVWPSNLERVSFFESQLSSLMLEPKCPILSTMFLQHCDFLPKHVPKSFFMYTVGLKVLDLSYTSLAILPESVYDLVNLRALILRGCKKLKHVGSLGKLKDLRMLDFSENEVEATPDGIEKLVSLKEFYWTYRRNEVLLVDVFETDRTNEGQLAVLDPLPKLLSKLVHLQCLILLDERVRELGAEELGRLTKLEILSTKFSSRHNFNSHMSTQHYRRLTHYDVQLVEKEFIRQWRREVKVYRKQVKVVGCNLKEGTKDNDEDQLVLPTDLQALQLQMCHLPASLWDVSPSIKKMMDLEECRIEDCEGIEYLCRVEDWIASLNTLYLAQLTSLRTLFKLERTDIGRSCYWNLKHLEVRECGNLKHLFMARLVNHHLQTLETIFVVRCHQLEDIIVAAVAEEEEEILSLPNLQSLKLYLLPKLKSIWKGTMTCDSLLRLEVVGCPKFKRLPISVHVSAGDGLGKRRPSSPPLQEIVGDGEWWDRVEWDTHPAAKSLFQPLFQLPPRQNWPLYLFMERPRPELENAKYELEEVP